MRLLLKENFVEVLQNDFEDLSKKFVKFYEDIEGLTKVNHYSFNHFITWFISLQFIFLASQQLLIIRIH